MQSVSLAPRLVALLPFRFDLRGFVASCLRALLLALLPCCLVASFMIRDRLIICIASSWDYDPTSKHHLMRILSRHNQILWVNYHGTRRPSISRWDLRDSVSAASRVLRGLRRVSKTIWQLTPLVIPGATGRILGSIHRRLLSEQIEQAIGTIDPARKKPLQIWTFAPDVHFLQGSLGEECFAYYCVDDYTKFEGFDAQAMAHLETRLLQQADVVIATSKPLWEAKKQIRHDAHLVPHGVDYDHFSQAWLGNLNTPSDLHRIIASPLINGGQRGVAFNIPPIFGFFGLIHHWFDAQLLSEVAKLRPDYSFVLIGDCKIDPTPLQLPNIQLLGRKDYALLPAYCAAYSAGLLPFKRNQMTHCVNPIKLMEYIAAGLPVVGTSIPALQDFGWPVRVADTPKEFALACDNVLACTSADRARISHAVKDHTWEARAETVSALLSRASRPAVQAGPQPQAINTPMGGRYWQPFESFVTHPAS